LIAYKNINGSVLSSFADADIRRILIDSVHPIRLLQVAKHTIQTNQSINYFNCDEATFTGVCKLYPVFTEMSEYTKCLIELLREFKLDTTELALFSAYLSVSPGVRNLSNVKQCFEANTCLVMALAKYMFARRNESESSDKLISMSHNFTKYSLMMTKGIYAACSKIKRDGYVFYDSYHSNLLILYDPNVSSS
jgi:hypothetical protein